MYAAVVKDFDSPPTYEQIEQPQPLSEHELLVDVLAAGLHPRVRSQANGSHYSSTDELPLVPGIDGVGRQADGRLVYFLLPDTTMGAMAEQTVVDLRRSVILDDPDPVMIAAAMNPAMSSWVGLRRRLDFRPGCSVLVMGATGSAGQLAVQIAKHFGAGLVVGAGRDQALLDLLPDLGADATVSLVGDADVVGTRLARAASEVDVVVDYLWGPPTEAAVMALLTARKDRARALTWLQIGSVAGPTAALPSAAFRSANFSVLGSGQGSVGTRGFLAEIPELANHIARGTFTVHPVTVPLCRRRTSLDHPERGRRTRRRHPDGVMFRSPGPAGSRPGSSGSRCGSRASWSLVDHQQFGAHHVGEVGDLLGADRRGEHGVVRAAGGEPGLGGGPEAGLRLPDGPRDRQLGQRLVRRRRRRSR